MCRHCGKPKMPGPGGVCEWCWLNVQVQYIDFPHTYGCPCGLNARA